jgi:YidC/Oxa1 family membrane protein insertase
MKDTNVRLFLAIALWLPVWFLYEHYFGVKKPVPPPPTAVTAQVKPDAPPAVPGAPQTANVPRETSRPATQQVVLETGKVHIVATSDGAALQSITLKGNKWTQHKGAKESKDEVKDLVSSRAGEPLPFSTQVLGADGKALIATDEGYTVVKSDPLSATFQTVRNGVTLTKTLTLDPATYGVHLAVELHAAAAISGKLAVLTGAHAKEPVGGLLASRSSTPTVAICLGAKDKVERMAVGAKTPLFESPQTGFAGIDEQYFLSAVLPPVGVTASCKVEVHGEKEGSLVASIIVPFEVAAGGAQKLDFGGYTGPKDGDELGAVAKPLREAIDWGWWQVIAELLLGVMKFFQRVVPPHNWGIAIILLTLAMKAVTFPLQHKSMKSMQEMQRFQPQIEELKKKYAGDTQRIGIETQKIYKEHGVNPLGSCLPMVIQMPIWFALYKTLQVSVDLYNEPFVHGWLNDLTASDPYYVLPVAMGATMILTQILTPSPMSQPGQKTMGYAMSGFFAILMLTLPSGLTLYIFTNNVLSIIQQIYLRRTMKPPPGGAALK